MKMEIISWVWMSGATLLAWYFVLNTLGRRLNEWYYDFKLGDKHRLLPPGDMGWPLLDNTWHYFKHPHLFMDNLLSKYGGNGYNALAMFLERIEDIVVNSLQVMADNSMQQPIEVFKETKSISMRVILHIFMGSYNEKIINQVEHLFGHINDALFSWPIYLPGFSYYNALQNRKKVQKIVKSVVEDRKTMLKNGEMLSEKKDLVDVLLELEDVNGRKLKGEDIVDLLILFLIAGHLSTATVMMWAMIYLSNNPLAFKKAKEEQEEIIKSRPPSQQYLSIEEIKQMVYLTKVINEVLRVSDFAIPLSREATTDVNINGTLFYVLSHINSFRYIIPKGWRAVVWQKACHMSSEYFKNPEEFDPSRWDIYIANANLVGRIKIIQMEEPSFLLELEQGYVQEEISPKLKCSSFFTISFVIIS
ncbi:hypothetical protein Ahy_A06g026910 [Arachis hypogaea]|uniref:Cytochrome P450 n=1 Tax=Arachis hypogaea TaxID=3818 RepID=A0A445CM64_ARAHY|nr:hypothetical protein Ahy_A06g026910 [Arachis hypogaea]